MVTKKQVAKPVFNKEAGLANRLQTEIMLINEEDLPQQEKDRRIAEARKRIAKESAKIAANTVERAHGGGIVLIKDDAPFV